MFLTNLFYGVLCKITAHTIVCDCSSNAHFKLPSTCSFSRGSHDLPDNAWWNVNRILYRFKKKFSDQFWDFATIATELENPRQKVHKNMMFPIWLRLALSFLLCNCKLILFALDGSSSLFYKELRSLKPWLCRFSLQALCLESFIRIPCFPRNHSADNAHASLFTFLSPVSIVCAVWCNWITSGTLLLSFRYRYLVMKDVALNKFTCR